MNSPLIVISGLIGLALMSSASLALDPLPQGPGIAKRHPGDSGLEKHPAVLLVENFEEDSLEALRPRWNEIENKDGKVLEIVNDHPAASSGSKCLQVTATLGENTGGHLFKRLDPIQTRVFSRFYVKFAEDAPYLHHFSGLGGYNPPTNWPQGSAGKHAAGDTRFSARIEPNGSYGSLAAPGGWMFYTYWHDMKQSADGGPPRVGVQIDLTRRLRLEAESGGNSLAGDRVGIGFEIEY